MNDSLNKDKIFIQKKEFVFSLLTKNHFALVSIRKGLEQLFIGVSKNFVCQKP